MNYISESSSEEQKSNGASNHKQQVPTGALDVHNAEEFMRLLTNLKAEHQTTILMVTHDPVAASYCDRILFVKVNKEKIKNPHKKFQYK